MHNSTFSVFIEEKNISKFIKIKNKSYEIAMSSVYKYIGDEVITEFNDQKFYELKTLMGFVEICFPSKIDSNDSLIEIQLPIYYLEPYSKIRTEYPKINSYYKKLLLLKDK